MAIFNRKNKDDHVLISKTNVQKTVLQFYGFGEFNHELAYKSFVSDTQANLFNPRELNLEISNQSNLVNIIKKYLSLHNFISKNWISEKRASDDGKSAYLIFKYNDQMEFVPIKLANRTYDVIGNLIEVTVFYDDYTNNNLVLRLYEEYQLKNNNVVINRKIYQVNEDGTISKEPLNFEDNKPNSLLASEQELPISYIPVTVVPNLPTERPDTAYVMGKIKALDIAFEQIVLDMILNSTKFFFNTNGFIGNIQTQVNDILTKFIKNNLLVMEYDPDGNPEPFSTINGVFKGKNLTDIYDWIVTEINKRIGVHIPAQQKGAQQSVAETAGVNVQTNNMIEQKLLLRQQALSSFIRMLLQFDRDMMKSKYFGTVTDIENLEINVKLEINQTLQNQIKGADNNAKISTQGQSNTRTEQ